MHTHAGEALQEETSPRKRLPRHIWTPAVGVSGCDIGSRVWLPTVSDHCATARLDVGGGYADGLVLT
jgi:hypothetical protein